MTKECKQQCTLRITQANATDLVVILYEMLLCYLEDAENALDQNDSMAFQEAVRKMRGCLNELIQSLHAEYEPAKELQKLYLFCIRRLARAQVKENASFLEEIRRVIEPLHDAYMQVAKQNHSGPLMGNSQTVYAGLTYGKNTLAENMADQGFNRGMLI